MRPTIHGITCILFISALGTLPACSAQKPTFIEPALIFDRPVVTESASSTAPIIVSSSVSSSPPEGLLIKVPFAPQAPFANWDALHEEACEEMSLLMVHHFLTSTPLSRDDAETELQAMIAWQREHGYGDDVSTKELGEIAEALYGYRVRVLTDVTAEILKEELRKGYPVIIPVAGRALKNPFFSGEGPWYHMLVVTGFTKDGFITNDPGTKRGEKYWYRTDVLMNALHDWTGVKEDILSGAKNAVVVEK